MRLCFALVGQIARHRAVLEKREAAARDCWSSSVNTHVALLAKRKSWFSTRRTQERMNGLAQIFHVSMLLPYSSSSMVSAQACQAQSFLSFASWTMHGPGTGSPRAYDDAGLKGFGVDDIGYIVRNPSLHPAQLTVWSLNLSATAPRGFVHNLDTPIPNVSSPIENGHVTCFVDCSRSYRYAHKRRVPLSTKLVLP